MPVVLLPQPFPCGLDWQQQRLTLASPPLSVACAGCECGEDAPSGRAGLCVPDL